MTRSDATATLASVGAPPAALPPAAPDTEAPGWHGGVAGDTLLLPLTGELTVELADGERVRLLPDEGYVVPGGTAHRAWTECSCEYLRILPGGEALRERLGDAGRSHSPEEPVAPAQLAPSGGPGGATAG